MPSSEKLKIGDVPKKFPYVATKRPLYYTERKESDSAITPIKTAKRAEGFYATHTIFHRE